MAELHVQRKRNSSAWIWVVLLIIVIAAAAYYYFNYYQKGKPIPGTNTSTTDSTAFQMSGHFYKSDTYILYTVPKLSIDTGFFG